MSKQCVINVDLADVFEHPNRKGYLHTLAWGDAVDVIETTDDYLKVAVPAWGFSQAHSVRDRDALSPLLE